MFALGAPAIVMPAPIVVRLSVIATPVYGEPVGFCKVMVRVLVSPASIVAGEKAFVIPTGCTFKFADAGVLLVTP